ncbi:MAG: tetratricopeptide repeat protein, partial [Candidatus Dormibacteraeota bacterium]|nr:tetratricopeptide repeat protein [Candidatus Dormibacteraeota bacterium]
SFDRAHSMPLDLAASQGLLGLAACTWFFVVLWWGIWRRPELGPLAGALAAYLAWSLLNFDWAPATGPFWLLAGLAWSAASTSPSSQPFPRRGQGDVRGREVESGRRGWWRPVAGVAAGMVALVLVLPAQVADVLYYKGRPQQAAAVDPLQPRYPAAERSLAGLQRAAALHDTDPSVYVQLGDALLKKGDRRGARAAYEQALRIYPYERDATLKVRGQ